MEAQRGKKNTKKEKRQETLFFELDMSEVEVC